jgi:SAM-dependent methyltransferase
VAAPPEACTLCGSTDLAPGPSRASVAYLDCERCGLRFARRGANPNLENELEDFEDAYIEYLSDDPADARNIAALRGWIERYRPLAGASLLDVGAGSGKFVRHLAADGVRARGVEPSRTLYDRFLASDPELFSHGFAAGEGGEPADVVTCLDVIEHVERPGEFLASLAAATAPGGTVVISTPDRGSLLARALGRRWGHYNRYHLSLFSRPVLESAAADAGLETIGFARRGRRRSLGYAARHLFEFTLERDPPSFLSRLDRVLVPLNTFDVMYLALRRSG